MTAARVVLLVLLTVSLDLAVPFVPATGGLAWDDEEEMVHMRRPRIVRHRAPGTPAERPREPDASGTLRVARAAARARAFAWRPLLLKPASSAPIPASPPEPH